MAPLARLLAVAAALHLAGCATLVRGRTTPVAFVSDPPGATVEVRGKRPGGAATSSHMAASCVTPCTLDLDRSSTPAAMTVTAAGRPPFRDQIVPESSRIGWSVFPLAVDILLVLPFLLDIGSQTLWEWPAHVSVALPEAGHGEPFSYVTYR